MRVDSLYYSDTDCTAEGRQEQQQHEHEVFVDFLTLAIYSPTMFLLHLACLWYSMSRCAVCLCVCAAIRSSPKLSMNEFGMLAEVISENDAHEGSFEAGSGGAGQGYNSLAGVGGGAGAGGGGGPAGERSNCSDLM